MRKMKIMKKILSLFTIIAICNNIFAAVVSDNDGAAFITKAEYDSLKNNFQKQIDEFNTSIDAKIDNAIGSYLAGVKDAKLEKLTLDTTTNYTYPLVLMYSTDLWNNPKSTNYYNLVRNRIRYTKYNYYAFGYGVTTPTVSIWDSDTDFDVHQFTAMGSFGNLILGILNKQNREIKGINAPLYNIVTTSKTRTVGSINYKVFDISAYGIGYQFVDYEPQYAVNAFHSVGHYNGSNINKYAYCGILGLTDAARSEPATHTANWTEAQFKSSGSGWCHDTRYDEKIPSYVGTKVQLNSIPEWAGHGSGGAEYTNFAIDSSSFVWDRQSVKTMLYAGTANVPAQLGGRFGFAPDFSDGATTKVECVDIQQTGFANVWAYNPLAADYNMGAFLARTCTYMPPMKAVVYDGYSNTITTLPSFSALPATCIRYYDEDNKEHFMDEGMFLKNFKKNGTVDFEVTFVAKSGTKTLNFYVSKEPFSRENLKTKLARFKVDRGSTTYTSRTLNTGKEYQITVDGIKSGEQLYIMWEPTTSGEYVALNNFSEFTITSG